MTSSDSRRPEGVGCANEGCPRPAERGERWCATCGLERALYRREARRSAPPPSESPSGRPTGGR